jgi:hypothetical protein
MAAWAAPVHHLLQIVVRGIEGRIRLVTLARFARGSLETARSKAKRSAQSNGRHSGKSRQTPLHCPVTQSLASLHGSP